ncbi:M4 family metallopeptidase [Streptomyces caniscabiei]|uniref:M4 family metallopeptidase n=1 Tax=Streptomyces caniscabiei TaxID=2746961 RepID=UPI0023DBEABE|nr:M4 family metallopeptidase [Streptomyces caniscabiei]MDX3515968.1 M4 family metallopeptidase [Streptomyces caniscabiei]MDX3723681.1 M4 family metallopeptidase [Streptomyces caniscabiei]MDX3731305.1 M4 family metallopeptidase [Streptomyces caniscabiei]WEO24043.1 M4 family metallopeptidase [Streptomyces caniscabiei]
MLRRQSHRRTSHTGNTFGRTARRRTAAGALVAVTALLAAAVQSGAATAAPEKAPSAAGKATGTASVKLTPAQRAELIREANATKADTAEELNLGAKEKLVVRDVVKDRDGTVHTRYERTYDGLPVLGGDLVVESSKAGETEGIVKATKAKISVPSLTPTVSKGKAEKQALGAAKAEDAKSPDINRAPRKVVWAASGKPVLAYETVVGGFQHDGTPQELHVITDATSGAKLYEWEAVETGTGNTVYSGQVTLGTTQSGSTYNLTDGARGSHKTYNLNRGTSGTGTLFSGPDDVWGNGTPSNLESAAADAHYGAALTWDYYKNVHGRSGIRGDGVGAYSRVHYGNNYVNAFWQDTCFCMTYGDGSGNANPLTSIDVAAHEMTHGLTSNTAGLNYSGESGGLNEATSDIFGSTVEFFANNSSDVGDYLIGEEININGDGTPLRYMDRPSKDGSSKDAWYSGIGSIDVHYSSGPANHFFYLLSEGSGAKTINGVSYNSPTSDGLPVTGIGRDKAEKIWFRALTTKFTSTTNYAAARTGTLAAAGELYGTTSAEYTAVQNAWAGINVGSRPGGGGGGGTSFESTTDVSIPDNGAAVTSPITVSGRTGNAPSNLAVAVDVVHTYIGDLQVQLVAPDGTAYTLKAYGTGGSTDNINTTYTVNASSEVANGVWQLRVQDNAARDTGYINSWKLTFP